ncbi:MAG: hypothetical protein V8T51_03550 [Senegalimassilia faecalis]
MVAQQYVHAHAFGAAALRPVRVLLERFARLKRPRAPIVARIAQKHHAADCGPFGQQHVDAWQHKRLFQVQISNNKRFHGVSFWL